LTSVGDYSHLNVAIIKPRQDEAMTGSPPSVKAARGVPLGLARPGFRGHIDAIAVDGDAPGIAPRDVERRLLELGFVEGAAVEVLHEGPLGRDPIAVRVNDTTIALRRREAMAIIVS
jgi:ferrous iron transport protein A